MGRFNKLQLEAPDGLGVWAKLGRWGRSRSAFVRRVSRWGGALLCIELSLFLAVGLQRPGMGRALDILLGTRSPFAIGNHATTAVPLALVSWLVVPAMTGAIIAGSIADWLQRFVSGPIIESRIRSVLHDMEAEAGAAPISTASQREREH